MACGSSNLEGMKKALEYSARGIDWGAILLISPDPVLSTIDKWNKFIVYELGKYIYTDFALLIHPDGFVVNPESWRDEFLEYDYVGSIWPLPKDNYSYRDPLGNIIRVGNSVSLRSKRLLDLPNELSMEWMAYYGNTNEDGFLSVHNRHVFEANGCNFAPLGVAKWFGREHEVSENQDVDKPFVFHEFYGRNSQYRNLAILL